MDIQEIIDIVISISNNIFILLSVVFLYTLTNFEVNLKKRFKLTLPGIVIGLVALFLMSNPFELQQGMIFDTRSILLPISGVFFGPIPTLIGAVITIWFRAFLGGSGMYVGISTIVVSSAIGISWRYVTKHIKFRNDYIEYFILGLLVNVLTLMLFFFLPDPGAILRYMTIPYMLLFPVVTMFAGVVMEQQKMRLINAKLEKAQKILLQSSIDSTQAIEIYAVNTTFDYLTFNIFHQKQMKLYYQSNIEVGHNLLDALKNEKIKERIKDSISVALTGESYSATVMIDTHGKKVLEQHFTPIFQGKEVIGAAVFIKDITEQKRHEESILKLSYYDALTGIPNRRFFQEKLSELKEEAFHPLTIISCDINGLKLINEALGHKIGDEVLVEVARLLTNEIINNGYLCRIGGDEFVYLLPNTNREDAAKVLENLDQTFENKRFKGVRLSISYGMAVKTLDDRMADVLNEAEDQMYKHKLFEITSHRSEFIKSILNTLQEKNPREKDHSIRVSHICVEIGKALNMKKHELNLLEAIAALHDIGKIAIDEAILNKPGKLTDDEWETIKKHPEIGYRIIATSPEYAEIAEDILSHHEHYNGKGYPRGLKGEDIPIRARIVSIADAYDAMVSKRTYREPLTRQQAIDELLRCSGNQFDPNLIDIFMRLVDEKQIKL